MGPGRTSAAREPLLAPAPGRGGAIGKGSQTALLRTKTSKRRSKVDLEDPFRVSVRAMPEAAATSALQALAEALAARPDERNRLRQMVRRARRAGSAKVADGRLIAGMNGASAAMPRGQVRLVVVAMDAWEPHTWLQHVAILAHVTAVPVCFIAHGAEGLGRAVGARWLDALAFPAECPPWAAAALQAFLHGMPVASPPSWFRFLPTVVGTDSHTTEVLESGVLPSEPPGVRGSQAALEGVDPGGGRHRDTSPTS